MKNTSSKFDAIAESPFGAKYILKIIDLTTNKEIKADIDDFLYSAMINDDDVFTIGNTCSATISFSIINPTVNLNNKEIEVYQGLNVNGTIEYIKLGIFKVLKPKKDRNITRYQCVDRMTYLMNMPYSSNLTFPTTDVKILEEICSQVGITLVKNGLISHSLSKKPSGYTRREIIAYMSQFQGKNARINSDGNLELIWYTDTDYVVDDNKIYYDGISDVNSEIDYKVEYIECIIKSLDGNESTIKAGNGTNGIKIENPFMTQAIFYPLAEKLIGFTFRGAEFEFLGDFRLEVGDIVSVETNGEVYRVPIMQIEHKSDGGVVTTITSVGETDTENEIDMSSPDVHAMDRYYAELVLINKAMINKLDVDTANITFATITQLTALDVEIEGKLNANELQAKVAELGYATIEQLNAETARIAVLEATSLTSSSAVIKDLQAGVTKTNTLIFGSATGDTIQTEFSNSVIAQLGDAQIESAMIKEISASKITGLDLNTTNLTIHSEDGLSYWKDNTIVFHDEVLPMPRIQIGKDGTGDYNMYIWNAQGKLMFDALGLTEDGVSRQIVRDDIIKNDADIKADKLNLESLFRVINNDSTYVLKSSKVWLDAEKQTLDVSFKVMSSNINGLQTTQASQGTEISTIQGQISSKIWQQDITKAIDDIEVGGRNLLLNSNFAKGSDYWGVSSGVSLEILTDSTYGNVAKVISSSSGTGLIRSTNGIPNVEDNSECVFSFYVKADKEMTVYCALNGMGNINAKSFTVGTEWTRIVGYFTKTSENFIPRIYGNGTFYIANTQLELGNVVTDWKVAPEDTDANITTLSTSYSELKQSVDDFELTVAKNYATIENVNKDIADVNKSIDDVDDKFVSYSTTSEMMAKIQAESDNITQEVSKTYTTIVDFNNLQVGGRNLQLGTEYWTDLARIQTGATISGSVLNVPQYLYVDCNFIEVSKGEQITISIDAKCDIAKASNGILLAQWYNQAIFDEQNNRLAWEWLIQDVTTEWKRYSITLTVPEDIEVTHLLVGLRARDAGNMYFKHLKVERGNKATDWTKAPEDVDTSIEDVNKSIENVNESINDVDAKFANYTTTIDMNAAIKETADSITQEVSKTYTTIAEFNNLQVGGRNLLLNSNFAKSSQYWNVNSGVTLEIVKDTKYGNVAKVISLSNSTGLFRSENGRPQIEDNAECVFSFYAKTEAEMTLYCALNGSGIVDAKAFNVGTEWTRIIGYFKKNNENFIPRIYGNGTFYIANVQLEIGNKVTDWTPAPEDIDESIADVNENISNVDAKFASYSTTAEMLAKIDTTAKGITQEVSETYTTITDFNNLQIGGVNLISGTQYWEFVTNDSYKNKEELNIPYGVSDVNTPLIEVKENKEYTVSVDIKSANAYTNNTFVILYYDETQTRINYEWVAGKVGTDFTKVSKTFTTSTGCKYIAIGLRSNPYVNTYRHLMLEEGNKVTTWSPNPNDYQVQIEYNKTLATQTADKFNWLVESGTSSTDFTLTDRMAELTAQIISLNGNVLVNGDMLVDGAITAEKLSVDAIKSRNYIADVSGSYLNLEDGTFSSKYLSWNEYGVFSAKAGEVGLWTILPEGGLMAETITSTPGDINRIYLQPFTKEYHEDTWVISSQHEDIDSSGKPAGEAYAYWYITGAGDFYTEGYIWTEGEIYASKAIIDGNITIYDSGLEIYHTSPYIDFHFGWTEGATADDYTARIIEHSSGALTVYNTIANASDRRLKQDICDLDRRYLNVLNLLKPKSYRFIKGSDNLNLGFIAQDVEKSLIDSGITDLPLISQNSDGIYALDYNQITALNTLGHLDHEKRIQQLENDLAVANAIIQSLLQSSV